MTELGMKVEPGFIATRFVIVEDDKEMAAAESDKQEAIGYNKVKPTLLILER
jgi:hypothetical protein